MDTCQNNSAYASLACDKSFSAEGAWRFAGRNAAFILGVILFVGGIMRIAGCFWGSPYLLHPDEGSVVDSALEMLKRRSFEPDVYYHPNHFSVKICSFLFTLYSYSIHGTAPYADGISRIEFHIVGRLFSAFCGTLMIYVAYRITKYVCNDSRAGLISAFLFAFYPLFMVHSFYATPDIPLTTVFLCFIYAVLRYVDTFAIKYLVAVCLLTAAGITVKYPFLFVGVIISLVLLFESWKKNDPLVLLRKGGFVFFLIFTATFFLAPNLFTNVETVLKTLAYEARDTHLGADGLTFLGNLAFYCNAFLSSAGYELLVPVLVGFSLFFSKAPSARPALLSGLVFWLCLSFLPLHWERWGLPMYTAPLFLAAIGIFRACGPGFAFGFGRYCRILFFALVAITGVNMVISSAVMLHTYTAEWTYSNAMRYCQQHGITDENTISGAGMTPFKPRGGADIPEYFTIEGEDVFPKDFVQSAKYIISNDSALLLYTADKERFGPQLFIYTAIARKYRLLQRFTGTDYTFSPWTFRNIHRGLRYLVRFPADGSVGGTIRIYERHVP